MKTKTSFLVICLLIAIKCISQEDASPFRPWQLISLSGQVRARGTYRESETNYSSKETEAYLNGVLQLRTLSYFVHPDFMLVNLSGTYNPETTRNNYIGVPDVFPEEKFQSYD